MRIEWIDWGERGPWCESMCMYNSLGGEFHEIQEGIKGMIRLCFIVSEILSSWSSSARYPSPMLLWFIYSQYMYVCIPSILPHHPHPHPPPHTKPQIPNKSCQDWRFMVGRPNRTHEADIMITIFRRWVFEIPEPRIWYSFFSPTPQEDQHLHKQIGNVFLRFFFYMDWNTSSYIFLLISFWESWVAVCGGSKIMNGVFNILVRLKVWSMRWEVSKRKVWESVGSDRIGISGCG